MSKAATARHARGLQGNRPLQALIAGYAALWSLLAIAPKYRSDWLLENLLVFAFVGLLAGSFHRFQFSNAAYACFALFLALHTYGAHYTYSEAAFGFWLRDTLGLARNPYDRIVHFSFGLLLTYPMRELMQRVLRVRHVWSYLLPFFMMLAMSAGYESIESWVARSVSPELGSAYLGTQGDEWDAQRDVDRAMTGTATALAIIWLRERRRSHGPPMERPR